MKGTLPSCVYPTWVLHWGPRQLSLHGRVTSQVGEVAQNPIGTAFFLFFFFFFHLAKTTGSIVHLPSCGLCHHTATWFRCLVLFGVSLVLGAFCLRNSIREVSNMSVCIFWLRYTFLGIECRNIEKNFCGLSLNYQLIITCAIDFWVSVDGR